MKNLASICIGVAAVSLAIGYGRGTHWLAGGLTIALGLLWLGGQSLSWRGWADLGLVALLGAAAVGMAQALPGGWLLLLGAVVALVAWDLAHFERRLRSGMSTVRDKDLLRRAHLRQLAGVAGLGLLLGWLALNLELKLGLGWAIGLGLLAVMGLGWLVRAVRG